MSRVIIVDLLTIADPATGPSAKNVVIEHVVKHPDTLIAILNGTPGTQALTIPVLNEHQFPYDTIVDNPLAVLTQPIVFKTMFAAKTQVESPDDYETVLVIDKDPEALEMWKNSGAQFVFNPSESQEAK